MQVMLGDLWRWRRMGYDSWRDDLPPHQLALKQTQGIEEVVENPDKVSSLLVSTPLASSLKGTSHAPRCFACTRHMQGLVPLWLLLVQWV
jgi:hypothetical protein